MHIQNFTLKRIVLWGLIARVIAFVAILLFSSDLSEGFISSDVINDDIRYLTGGEAYARLASSLIDNRAFAIAFSSLDNIYLSDRVEIWYWYICIGLYLFKSEIVLKLFNIVFALLTISCIYKIADKLYGRKVASMASMLYAIIPYPVFFCCFLYKDQLYTLVTLYILQIALYYGASLKNKHLVYIALLLGLSVLLRSGLAVIVAAIVLLIIKKEGGYKFSSVKMILPLIIGIIGVIAFLYYSMDSIKLKMLAYVYNYELSSGGMVQYFLIKSPIQIWKYPFSMLFMTLLPVNLSMTMNSWNDLVCCLNVAAFPVAFGNFLYFFQFKMKKDKFWWYMQLLYLITVVTSIEIFRHSYYLLPFTIIFFSIFYIRIKWKMVYLGLTFMPVGIYYFLFLFH